MSARPGSNLDTDAALPSLATDTASANPHILAVPARTGTDIELRIHTSITPFDVATEHWFPATVGFVVTVIVHTLDAATGEPQYLPPAEPAEWARAIFSTAGHTSGQVKSSVGAEAALSLIDAIPFWAAAFEVYPWLAAMISPLAAFR